MKKKKLLLGILAIVLVVAALLTAYFVFRPNTSGGTKSVVIDVTDDTGTVTEYKRKTDAQYLAQVFDEIDGLTVEGEMGDYGLYIQKVNGLSAVYEIDGAYWAIYVNGEYGSYGTDAQPVNDGDTFGLVYEKAQ